MSPADPSPARVVRTLKDGYWDRTEVIELPDGARRVRKRSKGAEAPGPWGAESLRREIRYLETLPAAAAAVFPRLLARWDNPPDIGYEIPFYADHVDGGELARTKRLEQPEIDEFQRQLAAAMLDGVNQPESALEPLSSHLVVAMRQALDALAGEPAFAALIEAQVLVLNGQPAAGPRAALEKIVAHTTLLRDIDAVPAVRIHGDFFLENILWRPTRSGLAATPVERGPTEVPQLILIDPVSVAGVSCALPLFDLVKYVSYATGELWALRSEIVDVAGIGAGTGRYRYRVRDDDPALRPFRERNWHGVFRQAFEKRYGAIDERMYRFIDGYFSLAMAVNTFGVQRQARLLKATAELNAVL